MNTASSRTLAVLGSPIAHSKSPVLHAAAYTVLGLDWRYELHEVVPETLPEFIASRDAAWRGLSLTMPLKKTVLPLVDSLDRVATLTGAANTLLFERSSDGKRVLRGFNTDVSGIVRALSAAGKQTCRIAQIVGGGATAASTIAAVAELGAEHAVVSVRDPARSAGLEALAREVGLTIDLRRLSAGSEASADLVISTLPGGADSGLQFSTEQQRSALLFDVAYDPWPSLAATEWAAAGGEVLSGLAMLVHQALLQVRIFVAGDALEPLPDEDRVLGAMLAAVNLDATGRPGAMPES
ncbi:MAG TPA: shikimate dehydrogenase [Microbacteriaceae bacterium]|nr:shikimate dehydrogenase [Microbacteriaceae bacterium]